MAVALSTNLQQGHDAGANESGADDVLRLVDVGGGL